MIFCRQKYNYDNIFYLKSVFEMQDLNEKQPI